MYEYYYTRVVDGSPNADVGGTIMGANKALAKYGVCTEKTWLYNQHNLTAKPSVAAQVEAKPNKITDYATLAQDLTQLKTCLANGKPFQIGFTVYESFEGDSANNYGIVPLPAGYPNNITEQILGGHAVLVCGFASSIVVAGQILTDQFIVRNSWGTGWGNRGYFYIPYTYFLDPYMASDIWVINAVPGGVKPPNPPTPGQGILLTDAFLQANGYIAKS
jgi:C1A family cysteine protease